MKRLRAMKRSTFFALLAVVLFVLVPAGILAEIKHEPPSDIILIGGTTGTWGNIKGHQEGPNNKKHITIRGADIARLVGLPNAQQKQAIVGAYSGGHVGLNADSGAQLWVVGSGNGDPSPNDGDVIIVLGN